MIRFDLPIDLMPSPRPRVSKYGTHMPEKYITQKELIRYKVMRSKKMQNIPLSISIVVTKERPKSMSRRKYTMPTGDVDNYAKTILDALNGVLYDDDTQIVNLHVIKQYGDYSKISFTIQETENRQSLDHIVREMGDSEVDEVAECIRSKYSP